MRSCSPVERDARPFLLEGGGRAGVDGVVVDRGPGGPGDTRMWSIQKGNLYLT